MEFTDFTSTDIDNLIEAVDAWEKYDGLNSLTNTMFMTMLLPKEQRDEELEKRKAEEEAEKNQQKLKKENCILLKSKLIVLRNKIEAKEFADSI